jgi:hypothetical protein
MLNWYVEYEGMKVSLDRIDLPAVREIVDPIHHHFSERLAGLDDEESDLDIVFVFDEERRLSVSLRGSPVLVNQARDILGEEDIIGADSS